MGLLYLVHTLQACQNICGCHRYVEIVERWLNRARIIVDGNEDGERLKMNKWDGH
jgi:hypothetical protein